MSSLLKGAISEFRSGRSFGAGDAEEFLDALITETHEDLLADVFVAWKEKGITEDEIFALAKIMRRRCIKVNTHHEAFVDVVGTGASSIKTFNVSTAAAFVVAGAGRAVAKHGNKAATSASGSADVLSALGVDTADPATAERSLNEIGVCFMFAPNFHKLSPTLGRVRRGLGFPTIFNCIGPLCNPANAPHQLIGVWDRELVPKMAGAMARLGTTRSWIVHGSDGLDEVTLSGTTIVNEIEGDRVRAFEIEPEHFGVRKASIDHLKVTTPESSARIIRSVLDGSCDDRAATDIVSINAAVPLFITGSVHSLEAAASMATDSISSGKALDKLSQLAMANRG